MSRYEGAITKSFSPELSLRETCIWMRCQRPDIDIRSPDHTPATDEGK